MDDRDRRILEILEDDGRASFTEIADEIEVSEGTVRNRVEQMEEEGIIDGFTVRTGSRGSSAIVMVKLSTDVSIEEVIQDLPGSIELSEVTGEYDLILDFSRRNREELNQVLDDIREVEGVRETKTYSVLKRRRL